MISFAVIEAFLSKTHGLKEPKWDDRQSAAKLCLSSVAGVMSGSWRDRQASSAPRWGAGRSASAAGGDTGGGPPAAGRGYNHGHTGTHGGWGGGGASSGSRSRGGRGLVPVDRVVWHWFVGSWTTLQLRPSASRLSPPSNGKHSRTCPFDAQRHWWSTAFQVFTLAGGLPCSGSLC